MPATPTNDAWPTARQVTDHLNATRPQPRANRSMLLIGIAVALLVLSLLAGPSPVTGLLPWLLVIGLVGYVAYQRYTYGAAQRSVQRMNELTMLRHHEQGLRDAWRSLRELRGYPAFYAQATLLLSANLVATRRFDAALAAHEHLIEAIPPDHPLGQVVAMQRALALLHEDRLADADDALRLAEHGPMHPMGRAMAAIGRLYQRVRTNQLDEIVASPESLPDELRPLGYDAAYGYGMIAAAMKLRGYDHEAARWWKLATLLLPAATIMNAVEETRCLAATPPARSLDEAMWRDGLG